MIEELIKLYENYTRNKLRNIELEIQNTREHINYLYGIAYHRELPRRVVGIPKQLKKLNKLEFKRDGLSKKLNPISRGLVRER